MIASRWEVSILKRQRLLSCLQHLHALVIAYVNCLDDFPEDAPERELFCKLSLKTVEQTREIRGLFSRLYGYEPCMGYAPCATPGLNLSGCDS